LLFAVILFDHTVNLTSEYRPKGSDALRLGSKGRYGSWLVAGKTV